MRDAERKVWQGRVDDLNREHKRTVEALTAWIEHLQAQLGTPQPMAPVNPSEQPSMTMYGQDAYVGEDEEALIAAHASGLIEDSEFQKAMDQVGLLNKTIEVEVNQ